ncbi:hypothetical protein X743_22540 [Mesorhizobium sp. LNHC252B00]|uniref:hypothetical protein n=1 Tax=Mesorhizobium sp. LNHC252B00 TaxID=1287252 RepID=UPI0003CE3D4B|nr:hypothetical protein [Mesorhizobium sp. LNHC252B00]ESY70737.1 hypothetical protein X743_22540 [Mesorhizobium sp. LNHC252B00]
MTDKAAPDEEPLLPVPQQQAPQSKGRRSFLGVRRELSEEELKAPGVRKMLLDDVDRLERELFDAQSYRDKFYEADKRAAILTVQATKSAGWDILSTLTVAVGSALLGFAPVVWGTGLAGAGALALGIALVCGGTLTKWLVK